MGVDALPPFTPGLALAERFFRAAVEPLLAAHFPDLRYAAARLGRGSDVMGFDTPQSRDHHWDVGSRIVASRLIVELMRLCFLIECEYWPYFKWFGTAFSRLRCADVLSSTFHEVMNAPHWTSRESALGCAYVYVYVGEMHNALGVTPAIEPRLAPFFGRPYQVPHAMRSPTRCIGRSSRPSCSRSHHTSARSISSPTPRMCWMISRQRRRSARSSRADSRCPQFPPAPI